MLYKIRSRSELLERESKRIVADIAASGKVIRGELLEGWL